MTSSRYKHMEQAIRLFFEARRIQVCIEPRGNRDADLVSTCGRVVGEIKHEAELRRDLQSKYWSDWNSSQSFGGKTPGYRLASELPNTERLSPKARGWVATIYGQLNNYRRCHCLSTGWLMIESPSRFRDSLLDATHFLESAEKIDTGPLLQLQNVGFIEIRFLEGAATSVLDFAARTLVGVLRIFATRRENLEGRGRSGAIGRSGKIRGQRGKPIGNVTEEGLL